MLVIAEVIREYPLKLPKANRRGDEFSFLNNEKKNLPSSVFMEPESSQITTISNPIRLCSFAAKAELTAKNIGSLFFLSCEESFSFTFVSVHKFLDASHYLIWSKVIRWIRWLTGRIICAHTGQRKIRFWNSGALLIHMRIHSVKRREKSLRISVRFSEQ